MSIQAPPGNREVKFLFAIICVQIIGAVTVMWSTFSVSVRMAAVYMLLLLGVLELTFAIRLFRKGPASLNRGLAAAGCVFIVGGALFDIIATVIHTPDLRLEGNPLVVLAFAAGYSLASIYAYAAVFQAFHILHDVFLWLALLRHRETLVESLNSPRDFKHFFKAVTGGAHLTWRQWLFALNVRELPQLYPLFWLFVVLLIASSTYRWCLGLEWFNVIHNTRVVVTVLALIGSVVCFYAWLWNASRRRTGEAVFEESRTEP